MPAPRHIPPPAPQLSEIAQIPGSLAEAQAQARNCTRCPLYLNATHTVFGEGPAAALVMFVGEQPGDREDIEGHPFVGPAGQLFDLLLSEAGVDRRKCYVTNAVKHFKNEPRGKRRLHKRPNSGEIQACRWWLQIELALLKPRLVVALGSTAAAALTGSGDDILKRRGTIETLADRTPLLITVHPSSLLRIPDAGSRETARAQFRRDMEKVRGAVPGIAAA